MKDWRKEGGGERAEGERRAGRGGEWQKWVTADDTLISTRVFRVECKGSKSAELLEALACPASLATHKEGGE